MGSYAKPYTDIQLLNNNHFKLSNGRESIWTLEDVKYLKHLLDNNDDVSPYELEKTSEFNFFTISRIVATIKEGLFDEFLGKEVVSDVDDFGNSIVNIYDGIHIEIHHHYGTDEVNVVKSPEKKKLSVAKLNAWSKRVRERDNYTCAVCDKYDKKHMEAHHIKPKSIYPDEALDDLNGVCVCQSCHRKYNNRYEPKNQNAVTWSRFISDERRGY